MPAILSRLYDFVIHDFVNSPFPCPSWSSWPFVDAFEKHRAAETRGCVRRLMNRLLRPGRTQWTAWGWTFTARISLG